jgi:hypothetical protein
MLLECRPVKIMAAEYKTLPFPALMPIQEVAFDLGVTATDTPLELAGVVIQGYNDHQLLFEQRWPARIIRQRLGEENLRIERGMGLALRSLHFQLHAYEALTSIEIVVLAQVDGKEELEHATLEIPVQFHSQKTNLYFPLRGVWWAIQGSDWSDMHKQEVLTQAYALDFARLGPDNRTFGGPGTALEDHYSWGQPVYAAAGGKVATVTYDMPDLAPGLLPDPLMFRGDPRRTLGNSVAISHGNGEFSYYACLQQASLAVHEGQIIKRGALLGKVGNSGVSPGPHLHFHLADGPHPFIDQGLPVLFSHFWAGGQSFTQPTTIPTRMIVIGEEE